MWLPQQMHVTMFTLSVNHNNGKQLYSVAHLNKVTKTHNKGSLNNIKVFKCTYDSMLCLTERDNVRAKYAVLRHFN